MISAVIPVFNEVESIKALHSELGAVASENNFKLDIIFVDDGSTDGSWEVIRELSEKDPRVHGIRFRCNFGKAAALSAGFRAVQGDLVMTMDADLQDDPKEIPRFLEKLGEGYDVVSGWKKVRHDPWHKVFPSRLFNWLVRRMTGVQLHDINCGMKCYRREVLGEVRLYGEMHRFIQALAAARGFQIGEISIKHRARKFGQSKYGFRRFLKGFLDLLTVVFLTGYSQRPQHLLGTFGLCSFSLGILGMLYLSCRWVISRVVEEFAVYHVSETALLYYSLGALLLGAQVFSLGFLAEMMTSRLGTDAESYSVKEQTGDAPDDRPVYEDLAQPTAAPDQDTGNG
ncbi:MAG: glycosyltransferase family 2 protein [Planctomycetales bacterium]